MSYKNPNFGKSGRKPQPENKVPFREHWPLVLKNKVSTRNQRAPEVACIKETLSFLTCLKENNYSDVACSSQAQAMQRCYDSYIKTKEEIKKKEMAAGDFLPGRSLKEISSIQLNKFLQHFPHKLKKFKL